MSKKLYVAYGSNMNLVQMARRCPNAKVLGASRLKDYKLIFRGSNGGAVATVEPFRGGSVPVLVWKISKDDEEALDRYEGFPFFYRKENILINLKGVDIEAMLYIMNSGRPLGQPSMYYYSVIYDSYGAQNFDVKILNTALENSVERA
jgi:hypothetical protein